MARICEVCGKGTSVGAKIVRHGMAKKKGGIGMHTTAVTTREFRANLHKVRVKTDKGPARKTVCAACIKHGKVTKA